MFGLFPTHEQAMLSLSSMSDKNIQIDSDFEEILAIMYRR